MDGVRGRVARFRAPGAALSPIIPVADESRPVERPAPEAATILWQPISSAVSGAVSSFIYISQRALAAVQDHCATERGACSGLLTGELYRSPDTEEPYVVVESTIRLPPTPGAGDNAKASLVQGWVVAQSVLRATGEQLVGWYRGEGTVEDGAGDVGLTLAEAEAHSALFPQPWQLAVKTGRSRGGVFAPAAGGAWAHRCLAFHELVDPSAVGADRAIRTSLHWGNYRTHQAIVQDDPSPVVALGLITPDKAAPPAPPVTEAVPPLARRPPRQSPRVLLPDQFGDPIGAVRPKPSHLSWGRRVAYASAYGILGLLAIAGLFRLYSALASPSSPTPRPVAEGTAASPEARLDAAADTLGLAIAAFDLRARMFASRQMQCRELARGLVLVEERWTSYNAARKDAGASLDSVRTARDRSLYADADGVERRFERSGCPRP